MNQNQQQINQTAYMASIVGQIGCLTVFIIAVALGAGLLLDNLLKTKPFLTIIFVIGSVPVTLFLTVRISLSLAARAQQGVNNKTEEETEE